MEGVSPRWLPALPWLSAFPELNVRTYVEMQGKPGVWFFSLDATNPLAVWTARRMFHLPYHRADISFDTVREDNRSGAGSPKLITSPPSNRRARPRQPARFGAREAVLDWVIPWQPHARRSEFVTTVDRNRRC